MYWVMHILELIVIQVFIVELNFHMTFLNSHFTVGIY